MAASSVKPGPSRREVFERAAAPWPYLSSGSVSLRSDDDDDHWKRDGYSYVVSPGLSSGAVVRTPSPSRLRHGKGKCAYDTLESFRAQDRDRKQRLRRLWESLKDKGWHREDALSSSLKDTAPNTLEKGARLPTAEERRKAAIRLQYQRELYDHITDDDSFDGTGLQKDNRTSSAVPTAGPSTGPTLERFTQFVEDKEQALWNLFCAIDSNDDMVIDINEIHHSLTNSGIKVSRNGLEAMMSEMDKTGSGHVTFEEWRDFLLLLPRQTSMRNVYSYWESFSRPRLASSIATQDGDVVLAEKPSSPSLSSSLPPNAPSATPASSDKGKGRAVGSSSSTSQSGSMSKGETTSTDVSGADQTATEEQEHGIFEGSAVYLLAGGLAGAVSRTATAPTDRLKVYFINMVERSAVKLPSVTSSAYHPFQTFRQLAAIGSRGIGTFTSAIKALYLEGGIKAFWVGNGMNIVKIFPESATKFWSYEYAKRWFARNVDHTNVADIAGSSRFVAGGIGGVTSQLLIYPLETVKTRVMSSTSAAPNTLRGNALYVETIKQMYMKQGFRSYWAGLVPALLGVFPYSAIDMSLFAALKTTYSEWSGEDDPGSFLSLYFGAVSGGIGATSVYPLNLIRTRMQTQGTRAHPQRYTGWRDVVTTCYRNEGFPGFYKGLTPTLLKVCPAMGISWVVYDATTRVLTPDNGAEQPAADVQES